jgi:hypothetical protein
MGNAIPYRGNREIARLRGKKSETHLAEEVRSFDIEVVRLRKILLPGIL